MSDGKNPVTVTFDSLERQSEKAYLLKIEDAEVWLPKSQCKEMNEQANTVVIPQWLAEKHGLV